MSQDNSSIENLNEKNFKAIIALKDESQEEGVSLLPSNIECRIQIGSEIRIMNYPVKETVFIDLEHLDANTPFNLVFFIGQANVQQEQILGNVTVNIPKEVTNHEEVEIKQSFSLSSSYRIKGSYMIIILNRIAFINNSANQHEDLQASQKVQTFDQQKQLKQSATAQTSTQKQNNLIKDTEESTGIINHTKSAQVANNNSKSVETFKQKTKQTASSVSVVQSRKESLGKGPQITTTKQDTSAITKQIKSTTSTTPLRQRAAVTTTTTNVSQAQLKKQKQSYSKDNKEQEEIDKKGKALQKMERYEKKLKFTPIQEQQYTATSWITHNRYDLAHDKDSNRQKQLTNKSNNGDGLRDNHKNNENTTSSEGKILENRNQGAEVFQVESQQQQQNQQKEQIKLEQTEKESSYSNRNDQILKNTKPQFEEKYPQPAVLTVERSSQLESERHSHSFGEISEPQGQQNWQLSRSGKINFSAASGIQKENGQQQEKFPLISEFPLTDQKSLSQSPIRHSRYSPISKRSREASPIPLRKQQSSNRKSPGRSPSQGGNALSVLLNLDGSRRQQKLDEETMKLSMFTMQSKLKRMSIIEEENEQLRAELQISEDSRKELSKILENQIELEQASKQEIEISSRQVSAEKNELLQTLTVKNSQLNQLARQFDEAVLQLKEYERKNNQLSNEIQSFSSLKQITQSYRDELSQMSIRLNNSSHDFEDRFTVLYREMAVLENEKAQLSKVNQELSTTLQTIELDNNQLRQLNLQKQYEIESLLRKLSIQTAYEDGLKINQAQVQAVELQLREERRIKEEQDSKILQLEKELENLKVERDEERVRYHEDLELLRGAVDKQKETISKQTEQLDEASRMGVYAKRESNQQEVLDSLLREAKKQAETERKRREQQELECNSFKKLNVDLEQVLQTQAQEIQQLRNNLKELANIVDEGEQTTANLRSMLFNQPGNQAHPALNANYQPVTDDAVDKCLGAFLNEQSHSLPAVTKQLFVRESSGVYQFGSKRVFVKAENDRIQVRTGGGFISLEEFLDLYTPSEVDKLQRNHPLAKLSSNYALNKKLSQSKCLSEHKEPADVQIFDPAFSQKQSMLQ